MKQDVLKRATCLLYLLMRDVAPTGEIVRVVKMTSECATDDDVVFTSKELEAYARRLAEEIFHEED